MHRIDIAYPSVDAKGNAVRLSGSIIIPGNVYNGSSPVDGVLLYNRYTQMTPECCPSRGFAEEIIFALIVLNSFNRQGELGFTPQQMFTEPLASKFDGWFNSGLYTTYQLRDSLKSINVKTFSEAVQPQFLDFSSDEYKALKAAIEARNLQNGWTPDPQQSYYYMHYAHDKAVPTEAGRVDREVPQWSLYAGRRREGCRRVGRQDSLCQPRRWNGSESCQHNC